MQGCGRRHRVQNEKPGSEDEQSLGRSPGDRRCGINRNVVEIKVRNRMNRLRKLIEIGSHEARTGRTAYVLRRETLPEPASGFDWIEDSSFNPAEAVLADAGLKPIFSEAIANGHAMMTPPRASPKKPSKIYAGVYTVEIGGTPIVSFEAKSNREAQELAKEGWFLEDLENLTVAGQPLWDGKTAVRARLATDDEAERYRDIAAEAEDTGDIVLAFLVTLDGLSKGGK
jgi:hypothetical protein